MAAILLFSLLGIAAVVAAAAMIGTWRQYGSAWDALEANRSEAHRTAVRYLTIRVIDSRNYALVPVPAVRKNFAAGRTRHGLRAAA